MCKIQGSYKGKISYFSQQVRTVFKTEAMLQLKLGRVGVFQNKQANSETSIVDREN